LLKVPVDLEAYRAAERLTFAGAFRELNEAWSEFIKELKGVFLK